MYHKLPKDTSLEIKEATHCRIIYMQNLVHSSGKVHIKRSIPHSTVKLDGPSTRIRSSKNIWGQPGKNINLLGTPCTTAI